jgi:glycosyltransferase involved in cell wall biosynthesis
MRVLVLTVVHHPGDARIRHREIPALLAAGHSVVYAAPFSGYGLPVPAAGVTPGLSAIDVPRARGRHRAAALAGARRVLSRARPRRGEPRVDVVLLHDPELLAATVGLRLPPTVWDVHEDTAAALTLKAWLPVPVRRGVAAGFRGVERLAERRFGLLLAEYAYADRFARTHPVVPNTTTVPASVPAPGTDRVVSVGNLTAGRGTPEMVAVGRELRRAGSGVTVHLIGPADPPTTRLLEQAVVDGDVVWHGFVPNDEALLLVEGALAGLSLLHDEANYRVSMPTKVQEFLAHGVPVISTPLPLVVELLDEVRCGVTVPFDDDPDVVGRAVAEIVTALAADPARAAAMAAAGRAHALATLDWRVHAQSFVAAVEEAAGGRRP